MLERSLLLILATVTHASCATAPKDRFADVRIEAEQARGHVHMLKGAGGNIGVSIGKDGVFLIDDQFAPLTVRIVAAVRKLSSAPIRFVLNTHWHRDHVGGNEALGRTGSVVVAHDNVRQRMSTEQFDAFFKRKTDAANPASLPLVTFNDRVTFHINGDTLSVVHVEHAHTDGDSIIFFEKANVVHMGDVYFNGLYPFIDRASGGHIDGVLKAVDAVLERVDENTVIIPGHGPIARKRDLVTYRSMLQTVRDRVAKGIEAGDSLEQIIAAKPTAEFDAVWGTSKFIGPKRWVEMLHPMLSAPSLLPAARPPP